MMSIVFAFIYTTYIFTTGLVAGGLFEKNMPFTERVIRVGYACMWPILVTLAICSRCWRASKVRR